MKKGKKKAKGKAPQQSIDISSKKLIVVAAAIFASICFVYSLEGLIGKGSLIKYASAVATGLLTGFSGNPSWVILLPETASKISPDTFKSLLLLNNGNTIMAMSAAASIMFLFGLYNGIKHKSFRYQPAVIIPTLGIPAMIVATGYRTASESSLMILSDFFNDRYLAIFLHLMILILLSIKWILSKHGYSSRHWLFSIIAGPLAGFIIGYMNALWILSLFAVMYFFIVMLLNEDISGALLLTPVASFPLIATKLIYQQHPHISLNCAYGKPEIMFILLLFAGFISAYYLSTRIIQSVTGSRKNTLFFSFSLLTFFLSLLHILFH